MADALKHALSPTRLISLAWLCGAVTLLSALALDVTLVRESWLELAVLIWLAPLAAYDLRWREVPHMACVAVPCAAAVAYSIVTSAWMPGVIAILAISASERQVLRHPRMRKWVFSTTLLLGGLLALASGEAAPGAVAVLGFWLAYEAGWWAGADALAAITLALLWPHAGLLVALAAAHLSVMLVIWLLHRCQFLESRGKRGSHLPGLPVIMLAVLLLALLALTSPMLR